MISIPQRLLNQPYVQQILSNDASYILRKKLSKPTLNREGYIGKSVLSMVLKGCQQITTYEGQIMQIPAGTMAFMPKGLYTISDLFADDKGFESVLFFVEDMVMESFLTEDNIKALPQTKPSACLWFSEIFVVENYLHAISQIVPKMAVVPKKFVRIKMYELLYLLEGQNPGFSGFLRQAMQGTSRNVKTFMETNYDKPLKVEDYAYLTGKSVSTFRREFKTRFGITPQKWLMNKRLEKAREILVKTEISVTQVAYQTGYENVSHFIKEFKKKYELTPKQLLLEHHNSSSI